MWTVIHKVKTLIRCNTLQLRDNGYYICIIDNELSIYFIILTLNFKFSFIIWVMVRVVNEIW